MLNFKRKFRRQRVNKFCLKYKEEEEEKSLRQISSPRQKPDVSIQANDSNAVHVQIFNPECPDDRKVMTQNMMIIIMITFKMATDEFQSKQNNCNCWLSFNNRNTMKPTH